MKIAATFDCGSREARPLMTVAIAVNALCGRHHFFLRYFSQGRCGRENQRFDDHGNRTRRFQNRADVDVVKLFELESVDRDHRIIEFELLAAMDADQSADVAVTDEHDRVTMRQNLIETCDDAAAKRIEPMKRR